MATNKEITGGSGDVNPQHLRVVVTQATADANTIVSVPIPVPRQSLKPNRSLVMEIHQILFDFATLLPTLPTLDTTFLGVVSTDSAALTGDPRTLANSHVDTNVTAAVTSSDAGIGQFLMPLGIPMNDGAGHGVLVATDRLFFRCDSIATGVIQTLIFTVLYRMKEVSLAEYIGIVQSQQPSTQVPA